MRASIAVLAPRLAGAAAQPRTIEVGLAGLMALRIRGTAGDTQRANVIVE